MLLNFIFCQRPNFKHFIVQCTVNTLGSKLGNSTLKMEMLKFRFFATFSTKIHFGEGYEAFFFVVVWFWAHEKIFHKKKKKKFVKFFFHSPFILPQIWHFGDCLSTKNAKSRHGVNIGASIGTIWSGESCIFWSKMEQNIFRHWCLNSSLVFLLVNLQKFEICLKTVMFGLSYLLPKAIYHQKIAS